MSGVPAFDHFAHDLRHYLREIVTQAQLAVRQEGEGLSQETRGALDRVAAAGIRADELIRAMAAYLDADARPAQQCAATQLLLGLQHELGAAITLTIAAELPPAVRLPLALRIVLAELIDNAAKFGASEVHLAVRMEEAELVAEVSDNAMGIEPEYHESIFQPFRRLHPRDSYPGFGLGLARASRLIEQLDGKLTVVASQPAKGSTFQLRLPLPVSAEGAPR
jgi:chemotaxis family two-component system sensor kinase Cph1